jgi:hypothetical protein
MAGVLLPPLRRHRIVSASTRLLRAELLALWRFWATARKCSAHEALATSSTTIAHGATSLGTLCDMYEVAIGLRQDSSTGAACQPLEFPVSVRTCVPCGRARLACSCDTRSYASARPSKRSRDAVHRIGDGNVVANCARRDRPEALAPKRSDGGLGVTDELLVAPAGNRALAEWVIPS